MREVIKQECPLCGTPAEYVGVDFGRRKYFNCPKCSYFQISVPAEIRLRESIQSWRDALSQKSIASPKDKVLVITLPSSSDKTENQNLALVSSYIHESEAPS